MIDDDELRGDRSNPFVQFELELFKVLERYADVRQTKPGYVAALLVEYADTIRQLEDLDVDVGRYGPDVWIAQFGDDEITGWIGAPRSGDHAEVDVDALDELLDADVTDEGISTEPVELVDLDGGDDA